MLKYILRRIAESIPVMFIVTAVTFVLIRLAPGGPFSKEKVVQPEVLRNLEERYHLNDPILKQLFDYIVNIFHGDFGPSFKYPGRTVQEMIFNGLPITFELGMYAILVALLIGVSAGVIAALKKNTWLDYFPMSFAMIGICMPSFLLGPFLVLVFGLWFNVFPVSGWDSSLHKVLPSITLGAIYAAYIARLSRGGMVEILAQDFIRTARAKGVSEAMVVLKHAMRGGLTPVVSYLGPSIAGLLSGSFIVESVFQIPGLGRFYVQAAFNRDYTMIMGTTVFLSVLIVIFNLLSDILLVLMNPRLTFDSKGSTS